MIIAESAGMTDIGSRRKQNEDRYLISDELGIFIVADGMGGHRAGEVASAIAVETVFGIVKDQGHVPDVLSNAVLHANQAIYKSASSIDAYRGMGTTVAAVMFSGQNFVAVNVGDSPIFWIHNGQLTQVSTDHTATVMVAPKSSPPHSPQVKIPRRVLTQSLGVRPAVQPDVCELPCYKNDILILASDGLTDKVGTDEIRDIALVLSPENACRTLIRLANDRGGEDNITVIVVKVKRICRFIRLLKFFKCFRRRRRE